MFLGKDVKVILKGQAKEAYLELKKRTDKESISILNSIERIKNILKDNPQFGDPIKKELIPNEVKEEAITKGKEIKYPKKQLRQLKDLLKKKIPLLE